MENNQLTPEDSKTIELIDERLKELNIDENSSVMLEFLCRPDISQKIVKMLDGKKQPSPDKDEVEYVRCVKSVLVFTEGHIYKLSSVSANNIEPFVMYNCKQWCSYEQYRMFFMPATKEEYQAKDEVEEYYCMREQDGNGRCLNQCEYCKRFNTNQAQQQVDWKVGEWVKKENGYIGIIIDISYYTLEVDPQDGMNNQDYVGMIEAIRPTEQEVFEHLRGIAEKKYPVGSKFISVGYGIRHRVANHKYIKYEKGELLMNGACVWYGGKWAEQVEDVKDRCPSIYDISVYQNPIDTDNYGIQISAEVGRKFTREFAKDLSIKIKNLLKN